MKQMHYYLVSDQQPHELSLAQSNIPGIVFNWILKLHYNIWDEATLEGGLSLCGLFHLFILIILCFKEHGAVNDVVFKHWLNFPDMLCLQIQRMWHKGRLKPSRMYSLALESCITSIIRVPHPREQLPSSTNADTGLRTTYLGFCFQRSVSIECSLTAVLCQKTVMAAGSWLSWPRGVGSFLLFEDVGGKTEPMSLRVVRM